MNTKNEKEKNVQTIVSILSYMFLGNSRDHNPRPEFATPPWTLLQDLVGDVQWPWIKQMLLQV